MSGDRPSTARGRELGDSLRAAIKRSGLSGKFIAEKLDWSETKVSHMLSGSRKVSEADVSALLALTGVVGERRDELLELCRDSDKDGWWWRRQMSSLPVALRTLIAQENAAVGVSEYQSQVIPGLLQTTDYARVLLRASTDRPDEEIEQVVTARLARQTMFSRPNPPSCTFYIDEYAVSRTGPGAEVMAEQLRHLIWQSARPHVSIRIVPGSGFHAGTTGSFRLTEFENLNPIVWVESSISMLFIEHADEVRAYRDMLGKLDVLALDEEESVSWIAQAASAVAR